MLIVTASSLEHSTTVLVAHLCLDDHNPALIRDLAQDIPKANYKLGLIASRVVRLIGLLPVIASQNIVHNHYHDVRNGMAEFDEPL